VERQLALARGVGMAAGGRMWRWWRGENGGIISSAKHATWILSLSIIDSGGGGMAAALINVRGSDLLLKRAVMAASVMEESGALASWRRRRATGSGGGRGSWRRCRGGMKSVAAEKISCGRCGVSASGMCWRAMGIACFRIVAVMAPLLGRRCRISKKRFVAACCRTVFACAWLITITRGEASSRISMRNALLSALAWLHRHRMRETA